jgi:hypothetical protein
MGVRPHSFQNQRALPSGPTYEEAAKALTDQSRGSGDENPEFRRLGNASFPDSTGVEDCRGERFATAVEGVNRAVDAAGIRDYCTGGDLHLPGQPIT